MKMNDSKTETLQTPGESSSDIEISSSHEPQLPSKPVEGGREAWLTTIGGCIALAGTFGYVSSFGVFQDYYTRHGTATSSDISWIGSVQLFLFIALGLPAGKLVDKGYFKHVLLAGSLIYLVSLFMLSLAHVDQYYQLFLSQGVGMGIGGGLVYLPSMAVQGHHWKTKRALIMGIVISGTSLGGIFYPIMLNQLLHDSVGFAWGVRASAFLTLGLLIIANLIMKDRLPPKKNEQQVKEREDTPLSLTPQRSPSYEVITDYPFLLMLTGTFLIILGLFFAYFYLQLFAALHNISAGLTFHQLTIQNAASIPGRILPGLLGDKFGTLNIFIIASIATGLLVYSMFGAGSELCFHYVHLL
ncbi:hypothetical protein Clacol_009664 [Clathrus columnatus]|uniref:Major facilitator superfamily (MFS) profile domain-containing protein n=1 Tax=Clathrus columnatus TaxID=1419009 RepID=A0AAV5ART0_9AGAM|nr:hypothetical protein Clacol_009664 [Clathrus columnatus]